MVLLGALCVFAAIVLADFFLPAPRASRAFEGGVTSVLEIVSAGRAPVGITCHTSPRCVIVDIGLTGAPR